MLHNLDQLQSSCLPEQEEVGVCGGINCSSSSINVEMTGVIKLTRKIFNKVCKRDLWRLYERAYKRDKDFLTELGKFLESSEKCLTQLNKKMEENDGGSYTGYMRILEKLNQHSYASERLLNKVEGLIEKQRNMYNDLTGRIEKSGNKKQKDCARARRCCLRMVTYAVFIGGVAAQFACTVLAAVLASPLVALAVAAAIIPTLAGQHWTLAWIEESSFEYSNYVIGLMQSGSVVHKNCLQGDIRNYLRRVVDVISSVITEEDPEYRKENIKDCLENVINLKKRAKNAETKILEARDDVSKSINFKKSR